MSSESPPRAVVFDWDNTLVDSWPVIHDALNTTFRAYGLPEWSLAETRSKVRKSMRDSFPAIFGDEWEAAGDVFYARYGEIHADAIVPAQGAKDAISRLNDLGVYLAVVSNKSGHFLREEAAHLGWTSAFGKLVGAKDAVRDKPDSAPVEMALEPAGLKPSADVWFVGDADIDLQCAVDSGCVPILVRPESPMIDEFVGCEPLYHFDDCRQLCNFFRTM